MCDSMARLVEAMVDRSAEVLEGRSRQIDLLSSRIFSSGEQDNPENATRDLESMLGKRLRIHGRLVAKPAGRGTRRLEVTIRGRADITLPGD